MCSPAHHFQLENLAVLFKKNRENEKNKKQTELMLFSPPAEEGTGGWG